MVRRRFRAAFGLRVVGKRAVYSPRLRHIRPLAAGREICIGAGATLLHPAGAQGLNLGIADARTFAECWRDNEMHTETGNGNTEIRLAGIARTYRHRRRGAHLALITATSASHLQVRRKLAEKLQESLITPAQVQDYDNGKIKRRFCSLCSDNGKWQCIYRR